MKEHAPIQREEGSGPYASCKSCPLSLTGGRTANITTSARAILLRPKTEAGGGLGGPTTVLYACSTALATRTYSLASSCKKRM